MTLPGRPPQLTRWPGRHLKRAETSMLPHRARKSFSFQPNLSTSTAPSATPTATESAGCTDVAALETSLGALKDVDVQQDGVDALNSAIADVKTDLDAAEASASSALQPQVEQVKTAFDALQTAATGLTTANLAGKAPAIASALNQVSTAAMALSSTLSQSCPES
jgi:hypothetical protein